MRAAVLLVAAACLAAVVAPPAAPGEQGDEARAAYGAVVGAFELGPGVFRERLGADAPATAWPLSQLVAAAIATRDADGVRAGLAAAERYWNGTAYESGILPPLGVGGKVYTDDNAWLALDLVAAHRQLGGEAWLRRAAAVYRFVAGGWDADPADACSGGIFWTSSAENRDRNTVSTANAALVALQLAAATGQARYVADARRLYGWVRRCLRAPGGLLYDHLTLAGAVDRHTWSYNQGAMIAAGALLARATGEPSYLLDATALANAALRHYRRARWAGEPPEFVAIFFRDLALLPARPAYRRALRDYLARTTSPADTLLGRAALVQLAAQAASWRTAFAAEAPGYRASR